METNRSPFYTEQHEAYRSTLRRWVENELEPYAADWDEEGTFPRELYEKAAGIGMLQLGFPEQYGGIPSDLFYTIVTAQELTRVGVGGLSASLRSNTIGGPPIAHAAKEHVKARVLPEILSGKKISALAITEPSGGSDVAAIKTTARREGNEYVVNGSKTFITSGMRADYYTVAVRTGGEGHKGLSMLLIERDTPGFSRTPLAKKMGWWASDTATLYFDDCRVPAENLIGEENQGTRIIMQNFNGERISLAASCNGYARTCMLEAMEYAKERRTFGKRLIDHQVIRHKFADMAMKINATQAYLESVAWRVEQGENPVADVCLLKNQASLTMEFCARESVQILGGAGFLRGCKSERIYREVRVNAIGGGAEEIMRDLAARQMGL